jgi:uncharacterized protein (TIGR03435 family)
MRFARPGLSGESASIPLLAQYLANMLEAQVADETRLTGRYEFKVKWLPDPSEAQEVAPAVAAGPNRLDIDAIFGALPQQLGLRLEARKVLADLLVVDTIDRPSAN